MKPDVFDTFAYAKVCNGTATLAIRETTKEDRTATLEVAVAFCAPEEQFSRRIGRMIALGRLNTKRRFYCCVPRNFDVRLKTQAEALLNQLIEGDNVVDGRTYDFGWKGMPIDEYAANAPAVIDMPRWIDKQKQLGG